MSVEQSLQKAKSYKKKGKVAEAKILYKKILRLSLKTQGHWRV